MSENEKGGGEVPELDTDASFKVSEAGESLPKYWRNPNLPKGLGLQSLSDEESDTAASKHDESSKNEQSVSKSDGAGEKVGGGDTKPAPAPTPTTGNRNFGIADPQARDGAFTFFKNLQVFQGLEDDSINALVDMVRVLRVPATQYIIRAGDEGDSMFFVQDGRCAVEFNGSVVDSQTSGKFFGEVALTLSQQRIASVRSEGSMEDGSKPATLLQLMRTDFEKLIEEYAGLKKRFAFIGQMRVRNQAKKAVQDAMAASSTSSTKVMGTPSRHGSGGNTPIGSGGNTPDRRLTPHGSRTGSFVDTATRHGTRTSTNEGRTSNNEGGAMAPGTWLGGSDKSGSPSRSPGSSSKGSSKRSITAGAPEHKGADGALSQAAHVLGSFEDDSVASGAKAGSGKSVTSQGGSTRASSGSAVSASFKVRAPGGEEGMGAASQGNASAAGGENRLEEEGEGRHVGNVNVSQGNVSQGNVSQQTSASAKRNSQRFMCERVYQHKHPFVRTSSGSRSRIKVGANNELHDRTLDFVRILKLFRKLAPEAYVALVNRLNIMIVPIGSAVFRQGDPGDALYIVYRGTVSVLFNGDRVDRRITGDCFGEVALTLSNARTADVIGDGASAEEDSLFGPECQAESSDVELLQLLKSDFLELVDAFPELRTRFETIGHARVKNQAKQMVESLRKTPAKALPPKHTAPPEYAGSSDESRDQSPQRLMLGGNKVNVGVGGSRSSVHSNERGSGSKNDRASNSTNDRCSTSLAAPEQPTPPKASSKRQLKAHLKTPHMAASMPHVNALQSKAVPGNDLQRLFPWQKEEDMDLGYGLGTGQWAKTAKLRQKEKAQKAKLMQQESNPTDTDDLTPLFNFPLYAAVFGAIVAMVTLLWQQGTTILPSQ